MLQHLWTDYEFPDGAKARGLAKLPTQAKDLLKELSTAAKRSGGLHAAAGTLGAGAGESVRLELLGIIFKSVGLPEQYASASFVMWLRDEGLEEAVRHHVEKAGRDFDMELANLYVSDAIAKAILAARSGFAGNAGEVKVLLEKQFPEKSDISIEDMIAKIKQAIGTKGKLPCTADRARRGPAIHRRQGRTLQGRAGCAGTVLLAAGGQRHVRGHRAERPVRRCPCSSASRGGSRSRSSCRTPTSSRSPARSCSRRSPSAEDKLSKLLDSPQRRDRAATLGARRSPSTTRDRKLLVQDYPILPVRRRFWERVLRAVDKAGTGAQLRTQLWIVYDAVQKTADLPLGNVVSGAFLYEHIKTRVLQSGVLLQEISETIAKQTQEEDGELRYQLCAPDLPDRPVAPRRAERTRASGPTPRRWPTCWSPT